MPFNTFALLKIIGILKIGLQILLVNDLDCKSELAGNRVLGGGIWSRIKKVGIILNNDANCDRLGTFVNQNCSSADLIQLQW